MFVEFIIFMCVHYLIMIDTIIDLTLRAIMTIIVYTLANYRTYEIGTNTECGEARPLPDVFHDMLPDWSRYVHWRDVLLPIFFIPFLFVDNKQEFVYAFLDNFMMIVTLKAICIFFTYLPPSNPDCHKKKYLNHCYHQIFSGHNSLVFLLYILYLQYTPFFKHHTIMLIPVVMYSVFILMTRAHYSVDILVSYIVVFLLVQRDKC